MNAYALLNQKAKSWWYYRDLRKHGQATEARKRERKSILSNVESLRRATLLTLGRGGWCMYQGDSRRLEGYRCDDELVQLAIALGVPTVDTRTIPDDRIYETIILSMVGFERVDEAPYGALSYAPVEVFARQREKLGATLHNI